VSRLEREYETQKGMVDQALESFKRDEEMQGIFSEAHCAGDFVYIQARNQYWFRYEVTWKEDSIIGPSKNTGWAHVFADLREFDRMTGSPDPHDSHGFRSVETIQDAYEGNFE
jgi:hypothetical protein